MSSKQFEIRLIGNSSKQYNSLDSNMKCRVNIAIESLSANPLLLGKKLDGKLAGLYSYRVGSYRIIYDVDIESKICNVHGIPHRGKRGNQRFDDC
jgi:mRNA-degrading endonuclease RelE of RelBE toxin-antitoxin system